MATSALYAGKMNQMPSLIGEVRKSVDDYSSELFSLKSKALNIRKSVCDLDDVIGMVQASTQIQEQKMESLERIRQKTEEFVEEAVRIDEDAAAVINQNKENFYNKYNYLKPDAEKSDWEEFWDDAAEWCKEHWQEIVTTVGIIVGAALAIAAVVTTGGAALVPLLTALGAAAGTAANISLAVAAIAVVSTIGAAALNIADTWGNIDDPTFNTWQSVFNWTSTISNGVYALGLGYNKKNQGKGGPPELINKSSDSVTYRRVQGGEGTQSSQQRLWIDDDGNVYINKKDKNLNISIDNGEHSQHFLKNRQGADVYEFEVPKWFDDMVQENTIPQAGYKNNPLNQGGTAPKLTDPTIPGKSIEFPSPWIEWMEEYGTDGRVIKGGNGK